MKQRYRGDDYGRTSFIYEQVNVQLRNLYSRDYGQAQLQYERAFLQKTKFVDINLLTVFGQYTRYVKKETLLFTVSIKILVKTGKYS